MFQRTRSGDLDSAMAQAGRDLDALIAEQQDETDEDYCVILVHSKASELLRTYEALESGGPPERQAQLYSLHVLSEALLAQIIICSYVAAARFGYDIDVAIEDRLADIYKNGWQM